MASGIPSDLASRPEQSRPEPGQILIVIHDFSARSSDELSLSKGDRVELIERDDDFGDGWYLGRHLTNGASGLFPEVYTRVAPRGAPSYPSINSSNVRQVPALSPTTLPTTLEEPSSLSASPTALSANEPSITKSTASAPLKVDASADTKPSQIETPDTPTLPPGSPTASKEIDHPPQPAPVTTNLPIQPKSITVTKSHAHGQDSPVMNETLSVIEEHITDMSAPQHGMLTADRRGTNDSGSEYSSHIDQRLSYINGEETDEDEDMSHTRGEVSMWSPDQVAEYLFTVGVEAAHCELFRDQEITGDVLLGLDQASIFMDVFELGSLGRRLKTWQKIKILQDEVNGEGSTRRNTGTYGSEAGSEGPSRARSRSTAASTTLPRIPSLMERPGSRQTSRFSQSQQVQRADQVPNASPTAPETIYEHPRPTVGEKRPSAASIREMHHSRQSSTQDFSGSIMATLASDSPVQGTAESHKKQPSFDRNWTMGSAISPISPGTPIRPSSSAGIHLSGQASAEQLASQPSMAAPDALDRGYFSGGEEVEGRQRNVLRKRGSTAVHSRNSSYTDEQRIRSATTHTRHSRFGSVDSVRADTPPSAAQKYYGVTVNGRRRTPSENSIGGPQRPYPPSKDPLSPTVTRLDSITSSASPVGPRNAEWPSANNKPTGLRVTSDAVTGSEKARAGAPFDTLTSPIKESPIPSPARTGSSTPSAGPSFELDSPNTKSGSMSAGATRTTRKKSKKETSAYTQGLEKKTPKEQMVGADYSGWMKKRSGNLMTTWKPRLFILKGRRLSYYYSENDQQEKGLIDISFHRVLPAGDERLTGLHAALTGATNSPTSPSGTTTMTIAETAAAAEPESSLSKGGNDSIFIFKLVPPRPGLTKAVNFTKPTVHYFAVPNVKQGRLWMAALMKATIDRDDSSQMTTTYQQKTISLAKAQAMRHRPPALMNLDEKVEPEPLKTPASDRHGLNIQGVIYDDKTEADSGVSGMSKGEQAGTNGNNAYSDHAYSSPPAYSDTSGATST